MTRELLVVFPSWNPSECRAFTEGFFFILKLENEEKGKTKLMNKFSKSSVILCVEERSSGFDSRE